jgi:hypothetical protein
VAGASSWKWSLVRPRLISEVAVLQEAELASLWSETAVDPAAGTQGDAAAYRFRVSAHNSQGSSSVGTPSDSLLPHHALSSAVHRDRGLHSISASFTYDGGHFSQVQPSLVRATSSSTLLIEPNSSRLGARPGARNARGASGGTPHGPPSAGRLACDVEAGMRYEVLLRREGEVEWSTLHQLGEGGASLPVEVGGVRCPAGCYVRLHAPGIAGWEARYSEPSARVLSPTPPRPVPPGGARLELKLASPLALLAEQASRNHIL